MMSCCTRETEKEGDENGGVIQRSPWEGATGKERGRGETRLWKFARMRDWKESPGRGT
jgi:hypothetical protein